MVVNLDQLPTVGEKRVAIHVTPDARRQVKGGHPWLYDRSITKISHHAQTGDLAVLFDKNRDFLAIGLFDPSSAIKVKILHQGKPKAIDGAFWRRRIQQALEIREPLSKSTTTNAYRIINGENDYLPGLVLDKYNQSFVLKVYSAAWFPHLKAFTEELLRLINPETLVLRMSRQVQRAETFGLSEGDALFGNAPTETVEFVENGLRFEANLIEGQKTGHFLDQRDNRQKVRDFTNGASVLDVFSCTGGFSVYAAAGGAREVVSVDQSRHALEAAKVNMGLNLNIDKVSDCKHETIQGDAFQIFAQLKTRNKNFDVIVVDPPSFAQNQANIPGALNSYRRLTKAALEVLNPSGMLVQASCSSRISETDFYEAVTKSASTFGRPLRNVKQTGHPVDHPISFSQGAYLKAIFGRAK